ncbi:MAG: hypothetical protein R3A12_15150 [Ignavibacteria bacterium]
MLIRLTILILNHFNIVPEAACMELTYSMSPGRYPISLLLSGTTGLAIYICL